MMFGLSGLTAPHCIGRKTDHMLATLSDDQSFAVSTSISGTSLVVINPAAVFTGAYAATANPAAFQNLPYYSCCTISQTTPFSSAPTINMAGPFLNYMSSTVGYATDSVIIDYVNL